MINSIRRKIQSIEVTSEDQAEKVLKVIPGQCPFARTIMIGKFKLVIQPICKWNPTYEQLVELRFKALCYLSEVNPAKVEKYI